MESKVSKPESKCTIGVHDLLIDEGQWGLPMVPREGKYLGLKDDVAMAGGVQFDNREAYPLEQYFTRAFIYACQPDPDELSINPYPLLH